MEQISNESRRAKQAAGESSRLNETIVLYRTLNEVTAHAVGDDAAFRTALGDAGNDRTPAASEAAGASLSVLAAGACMRWSQS